MKKILFLFLSILFASKVNASQEVHYQVINPISKTVISQDSIRLADSLQLVDKENKVRLKKKIILPLGLALATTWAIKGWAPGFTIFSLLALDILAMIYVLRRKHKPRTYENLKQREELRQNRKRKSERFNRSWNYVFFLGLLGLISQILIQIVNIQFLAFPSFLLFFAMMFYFIRGFKGKYASTSQEIRRLILAILGFVLLALPLLVILLLFSLIGHE